MIHPSTLFIIFVSLPLAWSHQNGFTASDQKVKLNLDDLAALRLADAVLLQEPIAVSPDPGSRSGKHFFNHIQDALEVMQSQFYELWIGTWPTAIDWTAAVINTHVSSTLSTYSSYLEEHHYRDNTIEDLSQIENDINRYFAQNGAFYFGENAFAIRNEAFDDMLWVVLSWLENIKFIHRHDKLLNSHKYFWEPWYGTQNVPAFAHRARVFYDLASQGWNTTLCGGGMTWNPRLEPYKNAITNQLYISASIAMYLYFPGDWNASPYMARAAGYDGLDPAPPHNPKYLQAAVDGYNWLSRSNMTNKQGLYVDGFHVTGWTSRNRTGTGRCDARNEMVYTYNQGVILSGLRGLWETTGDIAYLEDGHQLVRNVIAATGWSSLENATDKHNSSRWAGLGRSGILEEYCDSAGNCSQDAQTFKGIYFLHLTQFCQDLPRRPMIPGTTYVATKELAFLHQQSCREYGDWISHNARAAMTTRDRLGKYGSWWGQDIGDYNTTVALPLGAWDYRNNVTSVHSAAETSPAAGSLVPTGETLANDGSSESSRKLEKRRDTKDVNSRGRGRTVETQGSGLAVLRAAWELGGG